MFTDTHVHIHTYIHTYIHACLHAFVHIYKFCIYFNIKSLQHCRLYCHLVLLYKSVHGFLTVKLNCIDVLPLSNKQTRNYGLITSAPVFCLQNVQVIEYVTEKNVNNVII